MLDDMNVLRQRDPGNTRGLALEVSQQTRFEAIIAGQARSNESVSQVVIAGMGGSALAADMIKVLTKGWLHIPLEVVKGYELPGYVNKQTLVIAISHSGNTEETISCYDVARQKGCQLAAVSTGGSLLAAAEKDDVVRVVIPSGGQPRMATIYHLKALLRILHHFMVIDTYLYDEVAKAGDWLAECAAKWAAEVPTSQNSVKQLALKIIGKTPVFYAGELTWPLAYKWKISLNESSKNVAFWNQYPEFNHNEFMGWTSHPVEKPFIPIDIRTDLERPRIRERMELSDRLLSGMRPKAEVIELQGDSLLKQLLWGLLLADLTSIYVGILNNVNPGPVLLIEKLKRELS